MPCPSICVKPPAAMVHAMPLYLCICVTAPCSNGPCHVPVSVLQPPAAIVHAMSLYLSVCFTAPSSNGPCHAPVSVYLCYSPLQQWPMPCPLYLCYSPLQPWSMPCPCICVSVSAGRSLDFELSNFVSVNCQRTSIICDHEMKSKKWYWRTGRHCKSTNYNK